MTSIVLHSEKKTAKTSGKRQKAVSVDSLDPAPLGKTRILCFDSRGDSAKHEIRWYGDRFVCDGCAEADERSTKNVALAALGGKIYWGEEDIGCEALLTLLKLTAYINPLDPNDRFIGSTVTPGPIRDLWYDYQQNALLKQVLLHKKKREVAGKEHVYEAAMKAAVSCAQKYFDDDEAEDSVSVSMNVPLSKMSGHRVAWWSSDSWRVPVSPDWYESVYSTCKGKIGGHFVCGIDSDGTIYAIGQRENGIMTVMPATRKGNKLSWK